MSWCGGGHLVAWWRGEWDGVVMVKGGVGWSCHGGGVFGEGIKVVMGGMLQRIREFLYNKYCINTVKYYRAVLVTRGGNGRV